MLDRTQGKDLIDLKISESLRTDEEQSEWPQERFRKLLDTLESSGKPVSAEIPLSLIDVSQNIRRETESNSIDGLVEDIRVNGIIHPPTVTVSIGENGRMNFVMVAGHRRIMALKKLNRRKIPVMIRLFSDLKSRLQASFSENIQRKNMDPFDLANSFLLLKNSGMSYEEIASKWDFDVSTISRYVRFNKWGNDLVSLIKDNLEKIPIRFLFNLLPEKKYDDDMRMDAIMKLIRKNCEGSDKSDSVPKRGIAFRIDRLLKEEKYSNDELKIISDFLVRARIIKEPLDLRMTQM